MPPDLQGLRILVLNWRGPDHPRAGGAEQYAWEIAARFAHAGARVVFLTARPAGHARSSIRDGITLVRKGGSVSLYPLSGLFLLFRRHRFDVVIDCQNGIPFFAPLFLARSRTEVLGVIHHVHQDQFEMYLPRPLCWVARILEKQLSRLVYRHTPMVAVSPSTRADVRRRLNLGGQIHVIPNGCSSVSGATTTERSPHPRIAYLGRLVPHKRVDLLILAAARLSYRWPDLKVDVIGSGPSRPPLERLSGKLGCGGTVEFHGHVSEDVRTRLLEEAWFSVNPSRGEGWGITVIESNAAGRPCVGFRVPGLVDSIVEGVNGWLVDDTEDLLAALEHAIESLSEPVHAATYAQASRDWASHFSWERSARRFVHLMATRLNPQLARAFPAIATDSCTIVDLDATAGIERLRETLPASDLWSVDGSRVSVLIESGDVEASLAALERLGLEGSAQARAATGADLLFGRETTPAKTHEEQWVA